jgi:hypothetical protein
MLVTGRGEEKGESAGCVGSDAVKSCLAHHAAVGEMQANWSLGEQATRCTVDMHIKLSTLTSISCRNAQVISRLLNKVFRDPH